MILCRLCRICSQESGEEFTDTLDENDLSYEGGSRTEDRFNGEFEQAEFYEVDFGGETMYFVVGSSGSLEKGPAEEAEGVPDELDHATLRDIEDSEVYASTDRDQAEYKFTNWVE